MPDLAFWGLLVQFTLLLAFCAWLAYSHRLDRAEWGRERNTLIERLVPGSTPQPQEPERSFILGDDHAEWLATLDDETRAQVVLAEREQNGMLR